MLMGYEPSIACLTIQDETVTPEVHAGEVHVEDSVTLGKSGKEVDTQTLFTTRVRV